MYSSVAPKRPGRLIVEPTNHCNLSCPFCPRSLMKRPKGYMELSLARALADEAGRIEINRVYLHGYGEPTLHPDFHEIVRIFSQAGMKVEFSTNLIPIDREKAKEIARAYPYRVVASLDSLDARIYSSMRVGGKLEDAVRGLKNLIEARREVGKYFFIEVQAISTRKNASTIYRTYRELASMGIDGFIVKNFDTFAGTVSPHGFVEGFRRVHPYRKREVCRTLLRGDLVVFWDGTLTPCCRDWDGFLSIGKYPQVSLEGAFSTRAFKELFEAHLLGNFKKYPLCAGCNEWFY